MLAVDIPNLHLQRMLSPCIMGFFFCAAPEEWRLIICWLQGQIICTETFFPCVYTHNLGSEEYSVKLFLRPSTNIIYQNTFTCTLHTL